MALSPPEPEPFRSAGRPPAAPRRGLESSYHWQGPVIIATAVAVVCVVLLARGRVNGWGTVALIVVVLWAAYLALVRFRYQAMIAVDGPLLTTRRYRRVSVVDGRRVVAVREFLTSKGPCYLVLSRDDDPTDGVAPPLTAPGPAVARTQVPTAWLQRGHSTFFTWVLTWSPRVELDRGSRRTLDRLVARGLVEPELDPDG